jgi:hypothetical protein
MPSDGSSSSTSDPEQAARQRAARANALLMNLGGRSGAGGSGKATGPGSGRGGSTGVGANPYTGVHVDIAVGGGVSGDAD